MPDEEIVQWQNENPKEFAANILEMAKHELRGEFTETLDSRTHEDAIISTVDKYAGDNPDFDEMWDSGEIQEFMGKNPGHNAISAHMMLKAQKDGEEQAKAHEKAIEDAKKEGEQAAIDKIRSNRSASVLGAGPQAHPRTDGDAPELKDSKKFGGSTAVLADRSRRRRQGLL